MASLNIRLKYEKFFKVLNFRYEIHINFKTVLIRLAV